MNIQGPAPHDARCEDCGRGPDESHLIMVKLLTYRGLFWLCDDAASCLRLVDAREAIASARLW